MALTGKQRRFVEEYLIDLNATQAAIRAGYSPARAEVTGSETVRNRKVADAIAEAMKEREQRTEITQDMVLQRFWQLATADANDIVQYRRNCCRYCWGEKHEYQWNEEEFLKASKRAEEDNQPPPSIGGGFGFDPLREPHRECPECGGEGYGTVHIHDTRKLKGGARLLYAGVKQTKEGLEVKMHDPVSALEKVGQHLGMFKSKVELTGKDGGPITMQKTREMTDDELLAIAAGGSAGAADTP